MKKNLTSWLFQFVLIGGFLASWSVAAWADQKGDAVQHVKNATTTFDQMTATAAENRIPPAVLSQSYGVAIFPGVTKGGLIVGAQHGNGVLVSHQPGGNFSDPVFLSLTDISLGAQAGGETSSIVMVINSKDALNRLMSGGVKFGTDVTAQAGPTGTQTGQHADVYTYTMTKGAFAGAAITGGSIKADESVTNAFYGRKVAANDVLQGTAKNIKTPEVADRLKRTLQTYTSKA